LLLGFRKVAIGRSKNHDEVKIIKEPLVGKLGAGEYIAASDRDPAQELEKLRERR
jgi:hypothetical protein